MLGIQSIQPHEYVTLGRLLVATVFGGIIGFERERSGKVAGLRTHSLVSLGAALFTVTSFKLYQTFPSVNGVTGFDYHIVANILVGIGFIGAGAILKQGDHVRGITTAASLWVVAAIGMASGLGFYREAIATTVLVYIILAAFWLFERGLKQKLLYKSIQEHHDAQKDSD